MYSKKCQDGAFVAFRVLVGALFFMHGAQKFGFLGGSPVQLASLMGAAGIIEVLVGALVVLGLLARYAAVLGAAQMLVAYFTVHAPQGWNPLANQGELALLFFAAFLVLATQGSRTWSLDQKLRLGR